MGVVEIFRESYGCRFAENCAFVLTRYRDDLYTGVDSEGRAVIVVPSKQPKAQSIKQVSNSLKINCNLRVICEITGNRTDMVVHALTCLKKENDVIALFLELADLLLSNSDRSATGVLSIYRTLSEFFNKTEEISDNELLGLYGELFTIIDYEKVKNISDYWHSDNRMKYDFSITDRIKIEVKTTTKPQRIHHFKHEQIVTENFDVYVISYRMQHDDKGLSLLELINGAKAICPNDTKKAFFLNSVIKNAGFQRLAELKFNQDFARKERRIYHSLALPHFEGRTPEGVTSAEYDVDLSGSRTVPEADFLKDVILVG